MKDRVRKISVLGAGTWGATLAAHLASKKYDVVLWEFDEKSAARLASSRTLKNLKGFRLPESVRVTSRLSDAFPTDMTVAALPSFAFGVTLKKAGRIMKSSAPTGLVIATKGFIGPKALLASAAARKFFPPRRVAALTGPSHAEEVSCRAPTAIVAASSSKSFAATVQRVFAAENFRVYVNGDVAGCETAGALKNIYAIAAGIADGLKLGDNAKAALVARSLSEMSRAGAAMGGKRETFAGLAGVGDLIVTCYSRHSRNRLLGEMVGGGLGLKKALGKMTMVAEGVYAARAMSALKKRFNLDTPIADEVCAVLFRGKDPRKAVSSLMSRPLKSEP